MVRADRGAHGANSILGRRLPTLRCSSNLVPPQTPIRNPGLGNAIGNCQSEAFLIKKPMRDKEPMSNKSRCHEGVIIRPVPHSWVNRTKTVTGAKKETFGDSNPVRHWKPVSASATAMPTTMINAWISVLRSRM